MTQTPQRHSLLQHLLARLPCIEPAAFAACINEHLGRLGFKMSDCQITIDGKTLRGNRSGQPTHLQP